MIYWLARWYRSKPWTLSVHRQQLRVCGSIGATPETLKLFLMSIWPHHGGRPPRTVIIHVGANNIGSLSAFAQRQQLESLWEFLPCLSAYPHTEFIWSDILPKLGARQAGDLTPDTLRKLDRVRRDVNRFARRLSVRLGGRYIAHPSFSLATPWLYRHDGTHLAEAGCQLFAQDVAIGPQHP